MEKRNKFSVLTHSKPRYLMIFITDLIYISGL